MGASRILPGVLVLAWTALASGAAPAQPPSSGPESTTSASQPTTRPSDPLANPRTAIRQFLRAMGDVRTTPARIADAVHCLDLSGLPPGEVAQRGPRLADQLNEILQGIDLDTDALPESPPGDTVTVHQDGPVAITLTRRDGQWRFSAATLEQVPARYEALRKAATTQPVVARPPAVPPEFASPRATLQTFMHAVDKGDIALAASCLDLSDLPAASRREIGLTLARKLRAIMDRIKLVVYQEVPNDPAGAAYTWFVDHHGRIELTRQDSGERKDQWLFSAATVKSIEPLYRAVEQRDVVVGVEAGTEVWDSPSLWLRQQVPASLKTRFLGLEHYQWLGLLIALGVGWVLQVVVYLVLRFALHTFLWMRQLEIEPAYKHRGLFPTSLLAILAPLWMAVPLLDLGVQTEQISWPLLKILTLVIGSYALLHLLDLASAVHRARLSAEQAANHVTTMLVPLAVRTCKFAVITTALLLALGLFGVNVTAALAGLGIGGLAFALAAQDTLKNFFGSLVLVSDRPFYVGDSVKIGDVEGTVEAVGFRSTRIRTSADALVTVPNSQLTSATINNLGARRQRRFDTTLALAPDTPLERVLTCREALRELIRRHPQNSGQMEQVYFASLGPTALEISVTCFFKAEHTNAELDARERLLVDVLRLVDVLDIRLARPLVPGSAAGTTRPPDPAARQALDHNEVVVRARQAVEAVLNPPTPDPPLPPPPADQPTA